LRKKQPQNASPNCEDELGPEQVQTAARNLGAFAAMGEELELALLTHEKYARVQSDATGNRPFWGRCALSAALFPRGGRAVRRG
jgi:hypothetical protein